MLQSRPMIKKIMFEIERMDLYRVEPAAYKAMFGLESYLAKFRCLSYPLNLFYEKS